MSFRLRIRRFKEKLFNWEYWPFEVVYFPVLMYYLYLSAKARSLFFFSASNPSIPTGGLTGESKGDILDNIPSQWKAKTFRIPRGILSEEMLASIEHKCGYPLIAKPDVGERGTHVKIVNNLGALIEYLQQFRDRDFLIQEYIHFPLELGLFYYRYPDQKSGTISSITVKEFLSVTGDGKRTLEQLMAASPRALFQYKRREELIGDARDRIPAKGEKVVLEPIGNHCRGTKFLNGTEYVDAQLLQVFDEIATSIPGFYFGRFDLRCTSWEDLKKGKNIRILELNGAGAEPAHIYHPGFSLAKGIKTLLEHWSILYEISIANHKLGVAYMTWGEWRRMRKKTQIPRVQGPKAPNKQDDKFEASLDNGPLRSGPYR